MAIKMLFYVMNSWLPFKKDIEDRYLENYYT